MAARKINMVKGLSAVERESAALVWRAQPARLFRRSSNVDTSEVLRIQSYLREKFNTERITLDMKSKKSDSIEVNIGGEFIGVIYKDEDEGETSYSFNMAILDIDLPPPN